MTPREIKNALEDKGLNQRALAAKIRVSEVAVSDVINRKRISNRIMRAVSAAIGEDVRLVFTEYYLRSATRGNSPPAVFHVMPREIRNALEDRHMSQRALAREIGVSEMAVSDVINRKWISDRIMRAISAAIGMDHRLVFSEYYLRPPKRKTSKVSQAA